MDTGGPNERVRVLIGSPLEPYSLERIASVDPRLEVTYRPDLTGKARFPADHTPPVERSPEQEEEWKRLLAETEVMFDTYRPGRSELRRRAPHLRWIQFSSSGIAHLVQTLGLADSPIIVTNVAGIHARPLAEFVLMSMLFFAKEMPSVLADQRRHHWQRFAGRTLRGSILGVIGLGRVGREIARVGRSLDMRVVGTKRSTEGENPRDYEVDFLYPTGDLRTLLESSDY